MWKAILRSLMKQALHRPKMGTDAQANPRASGQSLKLMKISKRNRFFIKENRWTIRERWTRETIMEKSGMSEILHFPLLLTMEFFEECRYGKRNCLTRTNDIQGE